MVIQVEIYFVTSATLNGIWCIVTVSDLQQQQMFKCIFFIQKRGRWTNPAALDIIHRMNSHSYFVNNSK